MGGSCHNSSGVQRVTGQEFQDNLCTSSPPMHDDLMIVVSKVRYFCSWQLTKTNCMLIYYSWTGQRKDCEMAFGNGGNPVNFVIMCTCTLITAFDLLLFLRPWSKHFLFFRLLQSYVLSAGWTWTSEGVWWFCWTHLYRRVCTQLAGILVKISLKWLLM